MFAIELSKWCLNKFLQEVTKGSQGTFEENAERI